MAELFGVRKVLLEQRLYVLFMLLCDFFFCDIHEVGDFLDRITSWDPFGVLNFSFYYP